MSYMEEDCTPGGTGIDGENRGCWSVPPIEEQSGYETDASELFYGSGPSTPREKDLGFVLLQGKIYDLQVPEGQVMMFQNLCDNEDDKLYYSFHGDPKGIWLTINTGGIIKSDRPFYMLNRTHAKGIPVAVWAKYGVMYKPSEPGPIVPPHFPNDTPDV